MGVAESTTSEAPNDPSLSSSMNGDEVLSRLKAATGSASDSALATFLKVPYSTLASWRRRNAVPMDAIIAVAAFSGSTIDWLLLGRSGNGDVQSEVSIRPAYPYVSRIAMEYGIQLASVIFGNKVDNLRAFSDVLVLSCMSTQSTIDHVIQMQGGDEDSLRKQMDIWITRTILNVQAQGKKVD